MHGHRQEWWGCAHMEHYKNLTTFFNVFKQSWRIFNKSVILWKILQKLSTIRHNSALLDSTRSWNHFCFFKWGSKYNVVFHFKIHLHNETVSWFLHILNSNWWPSSSPNTINKRFVSLMDACHSFLTSNFWSCFWSF